LMGTNPEKVRLEGGDGELMGTNPEKVRMEGGDRYVTSV